MTDRMEPKHKMTVKVIDALRTIQGYTLEEYVEARAELISELAGDAEVVALARAAGNAAPLIAASAPAVASAPPGALADNPWPSAPPAFAAAAASTAAPNCSHGPRNALSKMGQYGLWKGWMCPTAKGTPDQCKAVYLDGPGKPGHNPNEWNSFPA